MDKHKRTYVPDKKYFTRQETKIDFMILYRHQRHEVYKQNVETSQETSKDANCTTTEVLEITKFDGTQRIVNLTKIRNNSNE